jgi:hypothetical protein
MLHHAPSIKLKMWADFTRKKNEFFKHHKHILLGDFNAKIGREDIFKPTIGNDNLQEISNDNGVNFAKSKNLTAKCTVFLHYIVHKVT